MAHHKSALLFSSSQGHHRHPPPIPLSVALRELAVRRPELLLYAPLSSTEYST
jgi:hypothetical protein